MTWWIAAAAAAVALILAGAALAVRFGRKPERIAGPEAAAQAADDGVAGFRTHNAVVGADSRAALAVGEDGRIVVLKAHGAGIAAREIAWTEVRSTGEGIVIETGERPFGRVALAGVTVLDIRRLAPSGMPAAVRATTEGTSAGEPHDPS